MKNVGRFLASGLLLSLVSLFLRAVGVSFQTFLAARLGAARFIYAMDAFEHARAMLWRNADAVVFNDDAGFAA